MARPLSVGLLTQLFGVRAKLVTCGALARKRRGLKKNPPSEPRMSARKIHRNDSSWPTLCRASADFLPIINDLDGHNKPGP
jgi:hypothetical protein